MNFQLAHYEVLKPGNRSKLVVPAGFKQIFFFLQFLKLGGIPKPLMAGPGMANVSFVYLGLALENIRLTGKQNSLFHCFPRGQIKCLLNCFFASK